MGFLDADNEGSLSKYLRDVRQWPVLSHEDCMKLFVELEQGSKTAKRKIINANLRLVISTAKKYKTKDMSLEDIIQEGNIGLMRAVDRFDHARGFRFSTYAIWWIKQAIGQHLTKNKRIVRMPAHIVGLCKKMRDAQSGGDLTYEQLGASTGASQKLIRAAGAANGRIVSMEEPHKGAGGSSGGGDFERRWLDIIEDTSMMSHPMECVSEKQMVAIVKRVMEEELTSKESVVLRLRYGLIDDPMDPKSYPITRSNFENDEEYEEFEKQTKPQVLDDLGSRGSGVQEDHGKRGHDGLENELQQRSKLAPSEHAKDGA